MNAQPKTVEAQQQHVAQTKPTVQLVPPLDKAQEKHPKAGSSVCAATRNIGGELVVCGLPIHHEGMHEGGNRTWRPSSGDES